MKVGDLVHWFNRKDETGIIIDIEGEQIKVVDLSGDFKLQTDWWQANDWKIVEEKPLTDDDPRATLQG